jgi:hypothetical protein
MEQPLSLFVHSGQMWWCPEPAGECGYRCRGVSRTASSARSTSARAFVPELTSPSEWHVKPLQIKGKGLADRRPPLVERIASERGYAGDG